MLRCRRFPVLATLAWLLLITLGSGALCGRSWAASSPASVAHADDPCDVDSDGDGVVDCLDGCPNDPLKLDPGICGCGVPDLDSDGDGTPDCHDACPDDPNKITPGVCGCGNPDTDDDGDGTPNCEDGCPGDPLKIAPGQCGCGALDTDTDGDGTADCHDGCPNDPNKIAPGACGCGMADTDSDGDGTPDCNDGCPNDPSKIEPGKCGCGVSDQDTDGDGTPDCHDGCPNDSHKVAPGACGCGNPDDDDDGDGTPNCNDGCPSDPRKIAPGQCGCGALDTDTDGDGTADCHDLCPNDPSKIAPGACGCGIPDTDSDGDGTPDCHDGCPNDPSKIEPGKCGCGVSDQDTDGDGTPDCHDACPNDPNKVAPGACGCGIPDTDSDGDGTPNCNDGCPNDPNKVAPGACGCGTPDTDSDGDGTPNCHDGCPNDPNKIAPGACGCGTADTDSDGDGTPNCNDGCPNDPNKIAPGACGCGIPDTDSDGDGTPNCNDGCPNDPNKIAPGACGCGTPDTDSDGDGTPNCHDGCPNDPNKIAPGACGCGIPDTDSDGDGTPNCNDGCPNDPNKIAPGACGCGAADTDSDGDGTPNCNDGCPNDPNKIAPGACGCGTADTDGDGDGTPNCNDGCPNDPNKVAPGACGCGTPDTDSDGDGTPNCHDGCPNDPNKVAPGACGCGTADTDSDGDGTPNCNDGCPNDPNKIAPGACGCGTADTDSDGDGTPNCNDGCPNDPNKITPGACGCGTPDTDSDGDGTPNCNDGCPNDPNKTQPGLCGCGAPDVLNTYWRDADGDGYGDAGNSTQSCTQPPGFVANAGDCDDAHASVHPGAAEVCGNAIDDDCNGLVDEGPPVLHRIAVENALPGNPASEWDIVDSGDASIQGYAAQMSVRTGETVDFKIKTDSTSYRLDVYRLGYYQGNGARRVATLAPSVALPQIQPDCLTAPSLGLVDCGNWAVSASWFVPCDATSGIYFAKLVRQDGAHAGEASHIYFVVRDDQSRSDLLFQTSDTTWQAYNSWGGASLYRDFQFNLATGRAAKVSYNRPINTRTDIANLGKRSFMFDAEYPLVRWLERNGYDVSYTSGIDTDQRGAELHEHKVFLSVGQDEYWSSGQRANVEAARDQGVHLAFFSGNSVFWKVRYENSIDNAHTPYRTLVCYKETMSNAKTDPLPGVWTGTWRDPRFSPPNDGRAPENGLKGTLFSVNGVRNDAITVSGAFAHLRFWRNTSIAQLAPNQTVTFPSGTLGHEWDEDLDNGYRPPGLFHLSETTLDVSPLYLADHGSQYGSGRATHALSLHRRANGALVFAAGTIQWSWGLDGTHDRGPSTPDVRMRQATVNLLADMGAQPATLDPALMYEQASLDTSPPTSAITDPLPGAVIPSCDAYTMHGTAVDSGGGVVAGVEVSVDGGYSWHPAIGREQWSYTWMPDLPGPATVRCRAVDDSGNVQATSSWISVVRRVEPDCPEMLYGPEGKPHRTTNNDLLAVELGTKIRTTVDGTVYGIRFYKGTVNPGIYQVHLWSSTGQLLASANAGGGPRRGWQEVLFATPVSVDAHKTYIAAFHSPGGSYPFDATFFIHSLTRGHLTALANGDDGPDGVYLYGPAGFPTNSFASANYWVDVVFREKP